MNEYRYIVLDQITRNQLGEYPTVDEAEACFLRFVKAAPSAAEHLEIWDDDKDKRLDIDPRKIEAVTAA